jgi:hypothetical protein
MSLTGRFNFRRTWTGKIVLQVEDERRSMLGKGFRKRWRDANVLDLAAPALRRLIDLRLKPQYAPEAPPAAAAAPAAVDGMAAPIEVMPSVPARPEGQPSGRIVTH